MTEEAPTDGDGAADTFEAGDQDRFSEWLRAGAEPDWSAALDHRFVEELAADEVDDAVFRRYLVQDYAFVETLVSVVGHAVGDAPSMDSKRHLAGFLGTLTDEEDDYFERSFDALDVPERQRVDPPLTETTEAFADLLVRGAREGGYAETLAVLLPVEWVYLGWANARADAEPDRFYLVEWIDLHAVPEFEAFVEWLREEMDREGPALSDRRQRRVARHFRRAVALEVAFFDDAYRAPDGNAA